MRVTRLWLADFRNYTSAEVAPAPDGGRLALITWPTPELDNSSYDADLRLLDPRDGRTRVVCALPSGGGSPAWSRDGRRLYNLAGARAGGVAGRGVFAVDLEEGVPRLLMEHLSACPAALCRTRDGEILATVAEGLDTTIDRLDQGAGTLVQLSHHPGALSELSASADGRLVACVRSTAEGPANVWAGPPEGPLRQVTDLRPE